MSATDGGPLAGIRVLDLTQFLSGPYGTQVLGDLGAEVIKLEAPQGDLARHIPPHFIGADSVYYLAVNRSKQSIVIDLKSDEGRSLACRLIAECDVVFENFRPGVLDRLGISCSALRANKPTLIWCSISGFGQDGPYRDKPAYDMIVQALSGGMSLTGEPGRGPVRSGIPIGDICAGLYAVIATLAALHRRQTAGVGETIDISMLDCQSAMLSYQAAYFLYSGQRPGRQGTGHDSIPTYRAFTCCDGEDVVVTANTEKMWHGLCRALGFEHLMIDPRFETNRKRFVNRLELWPLLCKAFLARPAHEWVTLLEREEVPIATVNSLDHVVTDPQIRHREMVLTLRSEDKAVQVMGNPIVLSGAKPSDHRYPPALGEDTLSVLRDVLGLHADEIARLEHDCVINMGAPPLVEKI